MSNCVDIHTDIVIPISMVNTINLFHDMEEINKLKKFSYEDDHSLKDFVIWWFLSEKNVTVEDDNLIISLGNHRSGHTWRDLRQTFHVLSEYIIGLEDDEFIHCPVIQSDESDGFTEEYKYEWIIKELD